MHVERVALRGRRVALEPLSREHLEELAAAIRDGELWKLPVTFVPHPDDLEAFLNTADQRFATGRELVFATVDLISGRVVGSTRFESIDTSHRRVEIGFTFIAKSHQRSHVNTEAKYLMMRHAFEAWGCVRIEFMADALNSTSRRAILRLGALEEGVMRKHMIARDGRYRDSVLHSITDDEWPEIKTSMEAKVAWDQKTHAARQDR